MADLSSHAYRVQVIRQLVDAWEEDAHVGIIGGGVCQVCGQFATFSGFYAALARHRRMELVSGHEHDHPETEKRAIDERSWRYCELCRRRVSVVGTARVRFQGWLCSECVAIVRREAGGREPWDVLHRLARSRYRRLRNRRWPDWATLPPP